ncbi:hypothetical protein CYMTET_48990 [Cymbomonas tetramitiformis]|uniref:Uncharacterized protein n=1 Tax=Cymbomonas tetramitiformis TaxID=36881 RepID=A0AAE0EW86_9CHLO|nr:hypothetical protein CYMTET_48990 [Cymbomonas tetramitiformis]
MDPLQYECALLRNIFGAIVSLNPRGKPDKVEIPLGFEEMSNSTFSMIIFPAEDDYPPLVTFDFEARLHGAQLEQLEAAVIATHNSAAGEQYFVNLVCRIQDELEKMGFVLEEDDQTAVQPAGDETEGQSAGAETSSASGAIKEGSAVMLTILGQGTDGCLKIGDVGEVIKDDGSDTPFQVLANGDKYWYKRGQLQLACEGKVPGLPAAHYGERRAGGVRLGFWLTLSRRALWEGRRQCTKHKIKSKSL